MTWRLALDRRRGDLRREARELAHAETLPSPSAAACADDTLRASELWRAIDALPDKLRIAIVLASIEGHDLAEVASLLRLPIGTVKSRLFLARRRLKEQLQWIR
jgi:RNA polymerase sigma-70 factor (ECF subfamily)